MMLVPLIVIGVLFLITWIVIFFSSPITPGPDTGCYKPHDVFLDPFHKCEYTEQKLRADRLEAKNWALERENYELRCAQKYSHPLNDFENAIKSPEKFLEEIQALEKDYPPKEIKLGEHNYKLEKKANK